MALVLLGTGHCRSPERRKPPPTAVMNGAAGPPWGRPWSNIVILLVVVTLDARAAQADGLGDQLWGGSIGRGNGRVGLPTGEIDRHPVTMKVINCRTRWWDRRAGRPGAWRNLGALGRGTVGAPVIVALAPRL